MHLGQCGDKRGQQGPRMDGCEDPDRSPALQDPSGSHFCADASVGREPLVDRPERAAGQGPRPPV